MNVSKVLIITIALCILMQSFAHISLNIDVDDLEMVNEFFDGMINIRPNSVQCSALAMLKKVTYSLLQMAGILLTLVGSNMLTMKLSGNEQKPIDPKLIEPKLTVPKIIEPIITKQNIEPIYSKINVLDYIMCRNDFGCNRNLCWRECKMDNAIVPKEAAVGKKAWCFTAPPKSGKEPQIKHHKCEQSSDCSPCWPCVSQCKGMHTFKFKKSIRFKT